MKSIYEIYVPVTSQEQADRLKAICLKYGLPIWNNRDAFLFTKKYNRLSFGAVDLWIQSREFVTNKTPITESEFLKLAKEFKQ